MRARHILHGSVTAVVSTDGRTADFELTGRDMGYEAALIRGGTVRKLGGFAAGHAGPFDAQGAEAYVVVDRRDGRIVSRGGDDGGVDWARVRVALASAYAPPEPAPKPPAPEPPAAAEEVSAAVAERVDVPAAEAELIDIPAGAKVFGFSVGSEEVTAQAEPQEENEPDEEPPEDTQKAEYDQDIWTQADADDTADETDSEPPYETEDTAVAENAIEGHIFEPEPEATEQFEPAEAEQTEQTERADEAVTVMSQSGWRGGAHPQAAINRRGNADGRRVAPFEGAYAAYDWVLIEQGRGHYLSGTKRGGSAIAIPGRYMPVVPERLSGFNDFAYARDGSGYWIKTFNY